VANGAGMWRPEQGTMAAFVDLGLKVRGEYSNVVLNHYQPSSPDLWSSD
jgi:hypothetical protein